MPDKVVWTLDGDEASWAGWALARADAPASPLVREMITARLAAGCTPASSWALDLGCGTGRAFGLLVGAGYRVVGVDPTIQAVTASRVRATQEGLPAWPVLASAAHLPLAGSTIALLLGVGTMFHLSASELAAALGEVRRVLQPDGQAVLHFLDIEDWRSALAPQIDAAEAPVPSYRAVVTGFASGEAIRHWIEAAGLELVSLELRTDARGAGVQRDWIAICGRLEGQESP